MLLPFVVGDGEGLLCNDIVSRVDQFYSYFRLLTIEKMQTGIDREVVLHVFL